MDAKESCVFRMNWLNAAHTIEDPTQRCFFYEALLQYALTGMKMDVPKELELAVGIIYSLIDIDKEKYERKVEKRREAGIKGMANRWGNKQADITSETTDNKDNKCYNGVTKITNIAYTDTATETDTVTDTDTGTVTGTDKSKDLKNTPHSPQGGKEAGIFNLEDYFGKVSQITIPKAIIDLQYENQYTWRMADGIPGYGLAVQKAVATKSSAESLKAEIQNINNRFSATTPFAVLRLAIEMTKMKKPQVEAVIKEYERSASEYGIFTTLLNKVEYINKGNQVKNLKAFLAARQQ